MITHTIRYRALKVRYWVKDNATGTEGAITKTLPATAYASNTYYDMTANLNVRDYDGDHYYMWDAQQQYWYGYEWTRHLPGNTGQPTLNYSSSPNYPQSNSDASRWHNESYPGYGVSNPATHSCAGLPNVNEMTWYAVKGEPRWDGDELWTTMGHLYKGGMWFKKKANISGFDANKAVDGSDWRTNGNGNNWSVSQTLPDAADAGNYFYLPALGGYDSGQLNYVGNIGYYWSSGAYPWSSYGAYFLYFSSGNVTVGSYDRGHGFRAEAFQ